MQIEFSREISRVISFAVFLTLMTACQYASSSATNQDVSTNATPPSGSANNYQQNSPVEPCIPHREKARKLRLADKIEEATDEFRKAIETGCGEIEIRRELAEMYHGYGQFDRAINEYQLLLRLDDKDIRAHWGLADIFILDTKNYQEGLNELLLAEKLLSKKDFAGRHGTDERLGQAYDGLENFALALKYYKSFMKGCSEIPEAIECKKIKKRVLELEEKP